MPISTSPVNRKLSDGSNLIVNPDGTTFRVYLNGGTLITLPNGNQRYISPADKSTNVPNEAAILSASLNVESEKVRARQLFAIERAQLDEELRRVKALRRTKSTFNAVEFTNSILEKLNSGRIL